MKRGTIVGLFALTILVIYSDIESNSTGVVVCEKMAGTINQG